MERTRNLGLCPDWGRARKLLVCERVLQPTGPPSRGHTHRVFLKKDFIYVCLERRECREKERERNIDRLTLARPATQACALMGNQTGG